MSIKRKPLVIIVSGAPGAGKTTLACQLAEYLRIPHVPRDEILRGIELTKGRAIDRGGLGIEVYYSQLTFMLANDISLVTDGTLYADISEKDIKDRLLPKAQVVNVHVRAKNEHERFYDREMNRLGWSPEWVDGHMAHLDKIHHKTVDPLDLGVPVIEVDATNGYRPSIAEIIRNIRVMYSDMRGHVQE